MRGSFSVARILGIEVRIGYWFLVLLAVYAALFYRDGGAAGMLTGIVTVLLVFACVLLHEFGHALAARHYGIRTTDITLHPIGGIARLERMPEEPAQELVIALAGPAVNLVIVLGLGLALNFSRLASGEVYDLDRARAMDLPLQLLQVNLYLFLFNLIPAFPMDGGRVLRALLAFRLGYARATQIAASVGQLFAVFFGLWGIGLLGGLGLRASPILLLIAFFIYTAAGQESTSVQVRDLARTLRLREAMVTDFRTLPSGSTLGQALDLLLRGSQHDFPVVDPEGRTAGVLTRQDMLTALGNSRGTDLPVAEIMRRDIPAISAHASFEEAFRTMQTAASPVLPVVDPTGRLVGLITPENVGELMMVQSVLTRGGRPPWRQAVSG